MERLCAEEIAALLARNPHWELRDGQMEREWTFADFAGSLAFVNRVAAMAEAAGHHPDIDIRYNRVRLALVTHDVGGLSAKDVSMVEALEAETGAV